MRDWHYAYTFKTTWHYHSKESVDLTLLPDLFHYLAVSVVHSCPNQILTPATVLCKTGTACKQIYRLLESTVSNVYGL